MDDIQREALMDNRLYLAEYLKLDDPVLNWFYNNQIINFGETDVAKKMEEYGRFCLVIDDCLPRGTDVFDRFCIILGCHENARAAAKLKIGEVRRHIERCEFTGQTPTEICDNLIRINYMDRCKAEFKTREKQSMDQTTRLVCIIVSDLKRESVPLAIPEKNPVLKYIESNMTQLLTHG